jgi:hypothetical protein
MQDSDAGNSSQRWTRLVGLRGRFDANLAALTRRDPNLSDQVRAFVPAAPWHLSASGDSLHLGREIDGSIISQPAAVTADYARQVVNDLRRSDAIESPILISGLDQGWLWDFVYRTEQTVASAPGHRLPLYLLTRDVERLWLAMHVHDWRDLLADPRCRLFVGHYAVDELEQHLFEHPQIKWPRINITVDRRLWPSGLTLEALLERATQRADAAVAALSDRINEIYTDIGPRDYARKIRCGHELRVMGLTSRYTTFLQHSMRDWLAAFDAAGHETRLIIEQADHEVLHPLIYLRQIRDFRPDLLLMIDHFRAEVPWLPQHMPAVMWVQDRLPNIFSPAAGAAQAAMDFAIGYGRRDCVKDYGYPASRFLESPIGVNEQRFARGSAGAASRSLGPESIAFVSHASEPAESIIRGEIDRHAAPQLKSLLRAVYERLSAVYARGEAVTQERAFIDIVDRSMRSVGVKLDDTRRLLDLISNRLNNAFFRHQTLQWLADAGADLHLFGRGWEKHPTLARFARGIADNQTDLADIYRSAAINLQVMPFGSAHQRLFEGLCAGGFFLLRRVEGDDIERLYVKLYEFVRRHHIADADELRARADESANAIMRQIEALAGVHPLDVDHDFVEALRATAAGGFLRAASTLWPGQYDKVAFATREELLAKVKHYLGNPQDRAAVADAMRRVVLQQVTYRGISERMLSFVANDLASRHSPVRGIDVADEAVAA